MKSNSVMNRIKLRCEMKWFWGHLDVQSEESGQQVLKNRSESHWMSEESQKIPKNPDIVWECWGSLKEGKEAVAIETLKCAEIEHPVTLRPATHPLLWVAVVKRPPIRSALCILRISAIFTTFAIVSLPASLDFIWNCFTVIALSWLSNKMVEISSILSLFLENTSVI